MSSNHNYRFSITNQQVTGVYEWDDGRWEREGIDHDEQYQVSGNQVIKSEWDDGRQEITTFQDADGDGIYRKVSESYTSSDDRDNDFTDQPISDHDSYRFSVTNQQVTGVYEWDDGRWEREGIDHDEQYQVSGNQVIKSEWDDGRQEITTFQDADGDGIYQQVSEDYVSGYSQNNEDTSLFGLLTAVQENQDTLLVHNGLQTGSAGADRFIMSGEGTFSVVDFNYEEGDRLIFDTGLGLKNHHDLAAHLTGVDYQDSTLALSFGDSVQISLTGISGDEISWDLMEVVS